MITPLATHNDVSFYARLPDRVRVRIDMEIAVLEDFARQPNRSAVEAEFAARLGKSSNTLYRRFYMWQRRGAAGLAPKRLLAPTDRTSMSAEFVEEFKRVFESINTDSVPQARRMIVARLVRGERIPGLGDWRELWGRRFPTVSPPESRDGWYPRGNIEDILPRGVSNRQLNRIKSTRFEKTAARQGTWAAHQLAPQVITTRVGLEVGQVLMMDDVWHNVKVIVPAGSGHKSQVLRPVELCCFDVLSAHKTAYGLRPRLWNEELKKHEYLKEHETRFLLAYQLCEIGYRAKGCILWLERGSASVDDELADLIYRVSGKAITVRKAPLRDARQLCSVHKGAAAGNPHFKAPLEAHHSIGHTVLSGEVGQVGRNRDVQPDEIFGRDKTADLILKIQAILPPALAQKMTLPFLVWDEYTEIVRVAYDNLANRDWHKLEGWEELQFFEKELCLVKGLMDWIPVSALESMNPAVKAAIHAAVDENPGELTRLRRQSPKEVWTRGQAGIIRLPKCCTPLILGPKNGIVREAPDAAEIHFGQGLHHTVFACEFADEHNCRHRLQSGRPYQFHINPFSPEPELFVSNPDGSYLGLAKQITVPCRTDDDGFKDRMKEVTKQFASLAAPVARRAQAKLKKEVEAMRNNTQVIRDAIRSGALEGVMGAQAAEPKANVSAQQDADDAITELYGR